MAPSSYAIDSYRVPWHVLARRGVRERLETMQPWHRDAPARSAQTTAFPDGHGARPSCAFCGILYSNSSNAQRSFVLQAGTRGDSTDSKGEQKCNRHEQVEWSKHVTIVSPSIYPSAALCTPLSHASGGLSYPGAHLKLRCTRFSSRRNASAASRATGGSDVFTKSILDALLVSRHGESGQTGQRCGRVRCLPCLGCARL